MTTRNLTRLGGMVFALLLAVCSASFTQARTALTESDYGVGHSVGGTLADISLEVSGGEEARLFRPKFPDVQGTAGKAGFFYRYTEMKRGDTYGITIAPRNKPGATKILVCISVDGRDINTGHRIGSGVELHSTWKEAACYVLSERATIEGWRESAERVRRFVVTKPANSLANQWNKDISTVGIIAVVIFRSEAPELQVAGPTSRSATLGTGAGEAVESHVTETTFHPRTVADEVFVLNYQDQPALKKLGVWVPEPKVGKSLWPEPQPNGFIAFPPQRGR